MHVYELLEPPKPKVLLEGRSIQIFEALLPCLLIEQDGNGGNGEAVEVVSPIESPPEPAPVPSRIIGMSPIYWFSEFARTLRGVATASTIQKRLKELGIKGEGAKRIDDVVKNAVKAAKFMLSNPGAVAYRIPVWTTQKPPKVVIKRWNEELKYNLAKELSKLDLSEGEQWKS